MKKLKYIRKQNGFIVFTDTFNHNEVTTKNDIISAGFCYIDTEQEKCTCFGESVSLGIESLDEDSDKMTNQFFNYY